MGRTSAPGVSESNVQNATYTYAADAEASDTYAITLTPAPSAYADGQRFTFKANTANTGAATLNVNGLGAKTIKKNTDQDLITGDIEAGSIVEVRYDTTNFQMVSVSAIAPGTGDMTIAVYDPTAVSGDAFDMDNMVEGTNLILTTAERTILGNTSNTNTGDEVAASKTVAGVVELATTAEIDTGTDTGRAVPVDQFVASKRNVRWLVFNLVEAATDTATATNIAGDFVSPIAGTILQSDTTPFYLYATNSTAGTTGTMVVDISIGGTSIMTTNKLDFDTTEKTTTTAATPPDLTTTALAVGDIITIDIDAIHTTAAKGLTVYMAVRE